MLDHVAGKEWLDCGLELLDLGEGGHTRGLPDHASLILFLLRLIVRLEVVEVVGSGGEGRTKRINLLPTLVRKFIESGIRLREYSLSTTTGL